jgi:hypothetical protein
MDTRKKSNRSLSVTVLSTTVPHGGFLNASLLFKKNVEMGKLSQQLVLQLMGRKAELQL